MKTKSQTIAISALAGVLAFSGSYKPLLWGYIKYWELQHEGRPMMFIFWAEDRALPSAAFVGAIAFFLVFRYFRPKD